MIEVSLIVQCWAAMAAFRAADPSRFADETGITPRDLGWRDETWRAGARGLGTAFLGTAFGLTGYSVAFVAAPALWTALCVAALLGKRRGWTVAWAVVGFVWWYVI